MVEARPIGTPPATGLGRIEAGVHRLSMRVYWEDTDASGIVYHANYLRFAERARSDLLSLSGLSQRGLMAEAGVSLAVRSCAVDYLRPARLDDEIEVRSRLAELRGASVTALQSVRRAEEELVRLRVRIACIDRTGRPKPLPQAVRAALEPLAAMPDSLLSADPSFCRGS